MSDQLAKSYHLPSTTPSVQFDTLQKSLYVTPFVSVMGAAMFLANAMYIEEDKRQADMEAKGT